MEYLYHGSAFPGITKLETRSVLNGVPVLYLTDNIPYALLYIWDSQKIGYQRKHITASVKNGIVCYDEQFPDQLKIFYSGVSGYLYSAKNDHMAMPVPDRNGVFSYSFEKEVCDTQYVPDVYNKLMEYEEQGLLKVARFNDQPTERKNQLIRMMSDLIVKNEFYVSDPEKAAFYQRFFIAAWKQAENDSERRIGSH